MTVLVTGAAGFIGMHLCLALLARGDRVVGIDDLAPCADPRLRPARLDRLLDHPGFTLARASVTDRRAITELCRHHREATRIVHLAALPGIGQSLEDPHGTLATNTLGHMVMLEASRLLPGLDHFVYASSSSVYGGNPGLPQREGDRVDHPLSPYAASKRAAELISQAHAHVHGTPQTGLRFFTAYGPWGRPDMAPWLFASAMLRDQPITLHANGTIRRDFTFVDDVVAGTLAVLDRPPGTGVHRLLNLGTGRGVEVRELVAVLGRALGRQPRMVEAAAPITHAEATLADTTALRELCGWQPRTPLEVGVPAFASWFRAWTGA